MSLPGEICYLRYDRDYRIESHGVLITFQRDERIFVLQSAKYPFHL